MVMKLFNILYAAGLLLLAAACEKDLPTFSDDEGFLIFNYGAGKKTGMPPFRKVTGAEAIPFC